MTDRQSIPRIRHEFKGIISDSPKAINFLGFDGKNYWIPRSICTLIKEKKGMVVATLAVFKFEEITGITAEPLTTSFVSLGGEVMERHQAPTCNLIESKTTPLLPAQRSRVERALASRYMALLCEAGTGKTLMSLTVAYSRRRAGLVNNIVVMCPASLQQQWKDLANEYFPGISIDVFSIHSASYEESLERIKQKYYSNGGVTQLIVDEVHLCRNQSAKRSRNIEKSFSADYCMILTAFPIERNAGDLFYQFGIMDRAIIGEENYHQFQKKFLLLGGNDGETVVAYQNTEELAQRINPYIVRLTKKEVAPNLPAKQYHEVYFDMSENQLRAYSAINNLMAQYEWLPKNKSYQFGTLCQKLASGYVPTDAEMESIFGNLGKLGDGATNVARIAGIGYDSDNARLKAFQSVIEQIDGQAVIWCNYIDEMNAVREVLPNSEVINGENTHDRDRHIARFKGGELQYLIISVAINEGFNLQNACHAVFYSDTYSRTKAENAADRIHRIGQDRLCHIWRLMARRSLDERIRRVRERKANICNVFDLEE
jgi:SNF2 family DNA or RNA helicase